MAQRGREILEHAVHTIAEQAVAASPAAILRIVGLGTGHWALEIDGVRSAETSGQGGK